jgi:drug/metabolite transporter (DMT)-like permease
LDTVLHSHPNIRGSLLMAAAMAAFTLNDTITKSVSAEINIGQIILVRGLFAMALIAAFAAWRGALRPLRTLFIKPVGMRVIGEMLGYFAFGDRPDGFMLLGAAIIVLSGLYAFYRERVRNRLRPAAAAPGLPPEGV